MSANGWVDEVNNFNWSANIVSIGIIDISSEFQTEDVQKGQVPWNKNLRLSLELATKLPASVSDAIMNRTKKASITTMPLLAIAGHDRFHGIWQMDCLDVNGTDVLCSVPEYEGSEMEPKTWEVEFSDVDDNLIVRQAGKSQTGKPYVKLAPPLTFHTRLSVLNLDSVETVAQQFTIDFQLELRLRAISREKNVNLLEQLLDAYGFDESMIQIKRAKEYLNGPDLSKRFASSMTEGCVDYSYKLKARVVIADAFELHMFPFDLQDIMMDIFISYTNTRVQLVDMKDFPSANVEGAFQVGGTFSQVGNWDAQMSKSSTSSVVYPQCCFSLKLKRHHEYYIWNVAGPIGIVTTLGVLSMGENSDGSKMEVADRLSITLTLLLTAVAYKLVVAGDLPNISYLTLLDKYVLASLGFLVLCALENLMFPALAYDRSVEPAEALVDEWAVAFAYLGIFAFFNLCFWIHVKCSLSKQRAHTDSTESVKNVDGSPQKAWSDAPASTLASLSPDARISYSRVVKLKPAASISEPPGTPAVLLDQKGTPAVLPGSPQ